MEENTRQHMPIFENKSYGGCMLYYSIHDYNWNTEKRAVGCDTKRLGPYKTEQEAFDKAWEIARGLKEKYPDSVHGNEGDHIWETYCKTDDVHYIALYYYGYVSYEDIQKSICRGLSIYYCDHRPSVILELIKADHDGSLIAVDNKTGIPVCAGGFMNINPPDEVSDELDFITHYPVSDVLDAFDIDIKTLRRFLRGFKPYGDKYTVYRNKKDRFRR